MPKKAAKMQPEPEKPLRLRVSRKEAHERIEKQIAEGQTLLAKEEPNWPETAVDEFRDEAHIWVQYTAELLRTLFTNEQFVNEFCFIGISVSRMHQSISESWSEEKEFVRDHVNRLRSIGKRLELIEEERGNGMPNNSNSSTHLAVGATPNIFIVHGHNEEVKQAAARLVQSIDLTPIILHEQTNKGRTIIEKFEQHSDVGFAVVLLSPDDIGGVSGSVLAALKPRARQNVILELGYFIGKLGRNRVAVLHTGSVELPTDVLGVLYIDYDKAGAWRFQLAKEIKAAGFDVDLNRVP